MATQKQKKLVSKLSENLGLDKPQTLTRILQDSGYTKSTSENAKVIMQGKGVMELFKQAGITPEKIAIKYNELLDAPVKNEAVSWDTKRKALEDLSKRIIDSREQKVAPQIQFIEKFLNMQMMKGSKPKTIKARIEEG